MVRRDIQRKWEKQHALLDKIYDNYKVGDEIKGAVSQFVPEWGEWSFVYTAWKVFQAAEILLSVGNVHKPAYGVMKTREEAHESLKAEQLASSGEKGSSKPRPESILRHVAGPDDVESKFENLRPLRKDESLALVEAARQYLGRKQLKAQKLKELRDGGINVPDSAIPLARDERLESVTLTLPYIDSLLSADTKYEQLAVKYRELEQAHLNMKRSYDALKRWRDQQVAQTIDAVVVSARETSNGHAQSGAANGRAEDSARSKEPAGSAPAREGEPSVNPGEARAPQSRDEKAPATR